jgi:hypothetical protein
VLVVSASFTLSSVYLGGDTAPSLTLVELAASAF